MPELRTDWLTGRSVLVAENRAQRPNEFGDSLSGCLPQLSAMADSSVPNTCPFCRGQEHRTPASVFELTDELGQWQTRVVPNMYPAVTAAQERFAAEGAASPAAPQSPGNTIIPALGVHEVIIESPRHLDRMAALSSAELRGVLQTYANRLRFWRDDGRFGYGLVFKNQGARAGASLAHLHSQFIALPALPPAVASESRRATIDFRARGSCPYCRLVEQERALRARLVYQSHEFVAFCPFASLQPYEVWLLPVEHQPFFEDLEPVSLDRLTDVLADVIRRVETVVPEAAYNLLLRTATWRDSDHEWGHWRIEILPRVNAFAGFEWASGMLINPVAPERAAGKLRSI